MSIDNRVSIGSAVVTSSPTPTTSTQVSVDPFTVAHPSSRSIAEQLELQRLSQQKSQTTGHSSDRESVGFKNILGHRCPIINCEVNISNDEAGEKHFRNHNHSPCNPTRHLRNGSLEVVTTEHGCPVCTRIFQNHDECLGHMRDSGHKPLMEPVPLAGYACPQCMLLFPSTDITNQHMAEARHYTYMYPFKGRLC